MEALIGPIAFCFMFLDIAIIFAAWAHSRFLFHYRLKKYHKSKWDELVLHDADFTGLNFFSFDITKSMYHFRTKCTEDLGDQYLGKLRHRSVLLFKIGIFGWMVLALSFIIFASLYSLARHH